MSSKSIAQAKAEKAALKAAQKAASEETKAKRAREINERNAREKERALALLAATQQKCTEQLRDDAPIDDWEQAFDEGKFNDVSQGPLCQPLEDATSIVAETIDPKAEMEMRDKKRKERDQLKRERRRQACEEIDEDAFDGIYDDDGVRVGSKVAVVLDGPKALHARW